MLSEAASDRGVAFVPRRRAGALYPKLRPGPHSFAPESVASNQRARLYGAMIELVAARKYEVSTVAELCALAGASKRTLYERFPGGKQSISKAAPRDRNRSLRPDDGTASVNLRMTRSSPANHPHLATVCAPAAPLAGSSRGPDGARARAARQAGGSARPADLRKFSAVRAPLLPSGRPDGARQARGDPKTYSRRWREPSATDLTEEPVPSGSYDERTERYW
jgi:AcrR family transcriptional regulator